MNSDDTFTFDGSNGAKIFTYRWQSKEPVRGVLQIAHGMGEHALRYRKPLQPLLDAGIVIYATIIAATDARHEIKMTWESLDPLDSRLL